MRSDAVVQHDDGTPTGSRSTSFFIRGILGPDVRSIFMRWLRRLGVRLLQRTTRQGSPTLDGEAYYQRCVSLIADMEDAEGAFVRGIIRAEQGAALPTGRAIVSPPDPSRGTGRYCPDGPADPKAHPKTTSAA